MRLARATKFGLVFDFWGLGSGGPKLLSEDFLRCFGVLRFWALQIVGEISKQVPLKRFRAKKRGLVAVAGPCFRSEKNRLNIKFLGGIFLGHPGPRRRDVPDNNFMQAAFFCCFRQGVAGMSRHLGRDVPDLEKLYARKLWADFSYPIVGPSVLDSFAQLTVMLPKFYLHRSTCAFKSTLYRSWPDPKHRKFQKCMRYLMAFLGEKTHRSPS